MNSITEISNEPYINLPEMTEPLWLNLTTLVYLDLQALAATKPSRPLFSQLWTLLLQQRLARHNRCQPDYLAGVAPVIITYFSSSSRTKPIFEEYISWSFQGFVFTSFLSTEGNIPVSHPCDIQPWLWILCLTGRKSALVTLGFFPEYFEVSNANTGRYVPSVVYLRFDQRAISYSSTLG